MMELLDDLFGHEGAPAWVLFLCSADNELISDFPSFSEIFRGRLKKEDIVEKIKDVESPPQYQRLINFHPLSQKMIEYPLLPQWPYTQIEDAMNFNHDVILRDDHSEENALP